MGPKQLQAKTSDQIHLSQQLIYLLQCYETCDNTDWGPHVCVLRSSVNIGSMKDVQTVKDSAKSHIGDLIRFGRWKKEAAHSQTAFPTNSQGGGNSSEKHGQGSRELTVEIC